MHPLLADFGSFELGGWTVPLRISSYGTLLIAAAFVAWWVASRLGRSIAARLVWFDLVLGCVVCGLLGAKLLNLLLVWPQIAAGERTLVGAIGGGGAWLGGVAGGALFLSVYLRRRSLPRSEVLAVLFTTLPLAHAIGRVGCLLAGCCYGTSCALPWAVTYSSATAARLSGTPLGLPLHPLPLYEALLEVANFLVCLLLWHRGTARWKIPFVWMGLYGFERFWLELLRGGVRSITLGLSTAQWLAIAMVLAAMAGWSIRRKTPQPKSS